MNSKTTFFRYLLFISIALLAGSFFLSAYYGLAYPKPLGAQSEFTPGMEKGNFNALVENRPEVVLIGDSILYMGVDQDTLAKQLGEKTYSIAIPGSGSAIWYLILKNTVIKSRSHPKYVVILFRDTTLTMPSFRTTGHYFEVLDDFAKSNEPLVMKLAFINAMSPASQAADQYIPLYSARWQIRAELDRQIRYLAASALLRCPKACADSAINSTFGEKNMDAIAINQAIYDSSALYTRTTLDFKNQVNKSFLPAMVEMAHTNDITLIFVRMKNMTYPDYDSETPALRAYIRSLSAYLSNYDHVRFWDLAHDERIKEEYFADSVHFNEAGKAVFTQILADELNLILK